jgi:hypothetical protein
VPTAVTVCCPNCWKWSELKSASACKRCGTPLVLPDGRRVDDAALAPPPTDPLAPPPPIAFNGAPMYALPKSGGVNWILAARLIAIGYGVLAFLSILLVGILVPHLSVPVYDPNTGAAVYQTVDLRAALLFVGILVVAFFGVVAWLIGYAWARVVLLCLTVLAAFSAVARMSGEPTAAVVGSLFSVLVDGSLAFVLVMSFLSPSERGPSR